MSVGKRILVIVHLCLACTLVMWQLLYPRFATHAASKGRLLLIEQVMGAPNEAKFAALPETQRSDITSQAIALEQKQLKLPPNPLSPFSKAWLCLSIAICLSLLLRLNGAAPATWLVPVAMLLWVLEPRPVGQAAEAALFPSETEIIANYLNQPLASSISEQKQQLTGGWERYLIANWANQEPADDPQHYASQLEKATYSFNLARIATPLGQPLLAAWAPLRWLLLLATLLWSALFAWFVNRQKQLSDIENICSIL